MASLTPKVAPSLDHFSVAKTDKCSSLLYINGSSLYSDTVINVTVRFKTFPAKVLKVLASNTALLVEVGTQIRTGDSVFLTAAAPDSKVAQSSNTLSAVIVPKHGCSDHKSRKSRES